MIYVCWTSSKVYIFNDLIFLVQVNAKISDYGIARFSMLDGLMLQEGTLAYRAPEVIRGETYSFKVIL